jgi:hypothetical protein
MSDSMLIVLFLVIVFAPCLVAFLSSHLADETDPDTFRLEHGPLLKQPGFLPAPRQVMLQELALSENFEIRSFPKGLARRRLLLRDTDSGVKLTIAQLREAAVELIKQGGEALVHELALVAAAMVATGKTVAVAAQTTLEAARNAYAWFAHSEASHHAGEAWAEAPPPIELDLDLPPAPRWREASHAA